ncbi:FAD-dependent monooxygenase [Amycolatopsis sp. NPDC004625]|uniref:FAD-dependent monooxygenase n=1 Tax=Amycolatopsis sp. NPDC004625 TaxID=3154670 RepID=UPI0033B22FF1
MRKTGGHAVDLFRPAVDITERMGVLPRVEALATGTTRMTVHREGARRPIRVDLAKVFQAASDRHVEVMRDDLSEIYYDAGREDVEYLFGDTITALSPDGDVTFEHAPPRRFDVVVGADGLHSHVRRLVFGEEAGLTRFIGAYLAVLSLPDTLGLDGEAITHLGAGRTASLYSARHMSDARAVFLFRRDEELTYHHRDIPRQKDLLRAAFTGMHPQVDRWLAQLDDGGPFYFDSITQLQLRTWSRGRVTLVGDAGYCPGPAVGGSTSLAVLGAYALAGELATAGGDHTRAFAAYEKEMGELVARSRAFAVGAARSLIPSSRTGVRVLARGGQLVSALPAGLTRALAKLNTAGVRLHDSMPVKDYAVPATA